MMGQKRSTFEACFSMSLKMHSPSCPLISAKSSSFMNWRVAASKSYQPKLASTSTPCSRASATRYFICAKDCRAFTTSLRGNEEHKMENRMENNPWNDNPRRGWFRRNKWIFFVGPLAIALFIAIGGEVVMQLWNWLGPALFGWRQINFWQALGLLVLCRILFGGWGGR